MIDVVVNPGPQPNGLNSHLHKLLVGLADVLPCKNGFVRFQLCPWLLEDVAVRDSEKVEVRQKRRVDDVLPVH